MFGRIDFAMQPINMYYIRLFVWGNGCLQMLTVQMLTVQMLTVQPVAEVPADGALQIVGGLHVW